MNEAIQAGSWYMDCDRDGRITEVSWSHALRSMLGYRDTLDFPNTLQSWVDILHPDDRDDAVGRLHEVIEDRSNSTKYDVDCRMKILGGDYEWHRAVAEVIRRRDGSARRIAGIFVNTDSEKQSMLQLKKSMEDNAAMEHLINSMARVVDHFAICDLINDHYEYHNINLESKYPASGRYSTFADIVAERFKTLEPLDPLRVCLTAENLRSQLDTEESIYKFEYCSMNEDIFRMTSFIPLEWKKDVLAKVLWVSIDITEQKRLEIESRKILNDAFVAAEHANKAKTEFLSNMSHDIRTPMNAIVGLTALAGANIDQRERVLEYLGKITKSSRHLLGLINEVLDMSRIESGRIALADEEFMISDLVDNLLTMVKPDMEEHRHRFKVHINQIEHEAVCGDSLRIQQVVTNLMSNAIKYTPDGGQITFSIKEKANGISGLGCFEFCIEDNGIGMTPEFQKIMFQPFSRADDHRTTKVQGTGLGMAITRNIVRMMDGNIQVESALNKGTKVTVTIYLKLQEKDMKQIKELVNLPVLVVDDDITSCESTVATLTEIGIAGEWVTSGSEAVARAYARHDRHEDYFAILMDWKMPGMDGIETTREIRKRIGSEVTIIVLTAYDYSEIEEEAREAGVDAFIVKPLFYSRLTDVFCKLVNHEKERPEKNFLENIAQADYSDKRILLVEDNDLNREIATEIIGMSKVEIDTAVNGREAVEKVTYAPEGWYDLVFMDIQMPEMNGYEATAAIRALPNDNKDVPICAMTANAFAEDVQMAENTGMNGHIAKPLDLGKLNEVLERWLG